MTQHPAITPAQVMTSVRAQTQAALCGPQPSSLYPLLNEHLLLCLQAFPSAPEACVRIDSSELGTELLIQLVLCWKMSFSILLHPTKHTQMDQERNRVHGRKGPDQYLTLLTSLHTAFPAILSLPSKSDWSTILES